MNESYCIVDKRKTPCTEPSGYQKDKRERIQFFCTCAVCGTKKVRHVKMKKPPKLELVKEKLKKSQKTS